MIAAAAVCIANPALASDPVQLPTTNGTIALLNLEAQISGLKTGPTSDQCAIECRVALIELMTLRGLILGRVADYERAEEIADDLVCVAPADATVLVARAHTRATFHRFTDALDDIARAEHVSLDAEKANSERAAIFQALGRYDDALAIREKAAAQRRSFENIAALAGLCAERGQTEATHRLYAESLNLYRGVSPFPVAVLDFQVAVMWMRRGELDNAKTLFNTATRRVPAFVPAQGHLAEVEAELGETETAIARLKPLATTSDDPDYAAQLARILKHEGRLDQSVHWSRRAAARYEDLIARHPEAFADHAAEFWLTAGDDLEKAVRFARMNLALRKTPRAYDLLSRAIGTNEGARHSARVALIVPGVAGQGVR